MFWSKNKKKVYPCIPQFYYIKVGFKGVYIALTCFPNGIDLHCFKMFQIRYMDMVNGTDI